MAKRRVKPDRLVLQILGVALAVRIGNAMVGNAPIIGKIAGAATGAFLYWCIMRGGRIAYWFELVVSALGFVVIGLEIAFRSGVDWGWLSAILFAAEAALLYSPPVRRFIDQTKPHRAVPSRRVPRR